MSAHNAPSRSCQTNGYTHVVGSLAKVAEGRDGKGDGLVDVPGELLGAAVGLGDVGGERGGHFEGVCGGGVDVVL